MEAGEYRSGLQTLRQAAAAFPDHPRVGELTELMQRRFRDLYLRSEADALPAVSAIALFNEFRELTPLDASGDEMIRRLADRLVAVDLLGQADALLAHQVRFRLKDNAERAVVGTRMAVVRLLDNRPNEALLALQDTASAAVSEPLRHERRLLEARAHAEFGDMAAALRTLGDDLTPAADQLRMEILWQAQDWKRVADVLQRLAGPPPGAGGSLGADRSSYALNLGSGTIPYVVTEPRVHGFGLAIFAKYPLVDVAVADLAIRGIPTVFATLRHPGGDVRVVATHPLPPVQPAAADRRDEQLTAIAALVRQETLPVVVVGDLNTTMYATNYRRFAAAAGLANARASRGLAPTWPTAWPWALRIPLDHILHGPGLVTTEFAALAPIGSDHLPVFAAFRIATGGDAVTE